jgi:hypothetical protein
MTKFWITAGLFFGLAVGAILFWFGILYVGIRVGEFMDEIERKYGFKGCVFTFLTILAVASLIVASILTITGV